MQRSHNILSSLVIFMLTTSTILGQDPEIDEIEDYSPAYHQTHYAAHWSAYVPLSVMAVAAIYLGIADNANNNLSSASSSSSTRRSWNSHSGSAQGEYYSSYSKYGSYILDRSSNYSSSSRSRCKAHYSHH